MAANMCGQCGQPNNAGHQCEKVIPGIDVGRQLSHATCWASVVAAVGNASPGAVQQTPAMLIVAQGVPPEVFKHTTEEAKIAYEAARLEAQKNGSPPPVLRKEKDLDKETRDVAFVLGQYYPNIQCKSFPDMKEADTVIAEKIKTSINASRPVIIVLKLCYTPLAGLDQKTLNWLNRMTHVVICTGYKLDGAKLHSLTIQDPARHTAEKRTFVVTYEDLKNGFLYIMKADVGPNTQKYVEKEDVKALLVEVILTEPKTSSGTAPTSQSV